MGIDYSAVVLYGVKLQEIPKIAMLEIIKKEEAFIEQYKNFDPKDYTSWEEAVFDCYGSFEIFDEISAKWKKKKSILRIINIPQYDEHTTFLYIDETYHESGQSGDASFAIPRLDDPIWDDFIAKKLEEWSIDPKVLMWWVVLKIS